MGQQRCTAAVVLLLLLLPHHHPRHYAAAAAGEPAPGAAAADPPTTLPQLPQNDQQAAAWYAEVFAHRHSLSPGHLQRSLAFRGANLRLQRLVARLLGAEPQTFHVGVIGGSISWGHGVQRGREDWFSLVGDWLRATFPRHAFVLKNGCVPATQSSYVSSCLQQFVSADVDLVFVEYVTNDGYHHGSVDNSLARSFERLLRKLLQFNGHPPAVVLVEFLATDVLQNRLPFYATGEDHYGVLAQYYSVPALSFRDAVWHEYMGNEPGFQRLQIFPPEEERHPTPLGHRYLADMAINLLQQTFLDLVLHPPAAAAGGGGGDDGDAEELLLQVPPPMFAGNYESSNLVCVVGESLPASVAINEGFEWVNEGTPEKPKWGFVSWEVGARLVLRVDTRAAAGSAGAGAPPAPPMKQQQQQRAGSGGSKAAAPQQARGGASPATTTVATSSSSSNSNRGASPTATTTGATTTTTPVPDMIVWVGYVKSWRHMGSASLSCLSGCVCHSTAVDAMHEAGNTQQHMAKLYATQAAECLVEVKINEWAQSKDHKFKVTALMVTHAVEFSGHGDFTDTVLLDSMYADERDAGGGSSPAATPGGSGSSSSSSGPARP